MKRSLFDKVIDEKTFMLLQEEAARMLAEHGDLPGNDANIAHWKSIVDGKVPFGYRIKKD